jgi:hypothetical protein
VVGVEREALAGDVELARAQDLISKCRRRAIG